MITATYGGLVQFVCGELFYMYAIYAPVVGVKGVDRIRPGLSS